MRVNRRDCGCRDPRGRGAAPAESARRPTGGRTRRGLSAFRIWFAWTASRSPRFPPTASESPTPCAPRTWKRTRCAPASGCSRPASETRRRLAAHGFGGEFECRRVERRRALHLLPVESQRLDAGVAARRRAANRCKITNLPLDVGSFRVSPKADRLLVSLEVFRDCADLACTKQRLDAAAHNPAPRVLYDRIFRAALGHLERRAPLAALLDSARRGGPRQRHAR